MFHPPPLHIGQFTGNDCHCCRIVARFFFILAPTFRACALVAIEFSIVLKPLAAMANEDLTQFEGLLAQLMSHENNIRQQAEVRASIFFVCIYFLLLITVISSI
jgi:hypothetical protein